MQHQYLGYAKTNFSIAVLNWRSKFSFEYKTPTYLK